MQDTKKKNKLWIVICALCVGVLTATGALIGVLAASTQSVVSSFNANYEIGDNIAFKITSYLQYQGEEEGTEIGSVQYNTNGSKTGDIPKQDITFSPEKTRMIISYKFENLSTNAVYYTMSWEDLSEYAKWEAGSPLVITQTDKFSNIAVYYSCGDESNYPNGITDVFAENSNSLVGDYRFFPDGFPTIYDPTGYGFKIEIPGNSTYYFSVGIGVDDVNKSAYCHSEGETGLTFIFTDKDVWDSTHS